MKKIKIDIILIIGLILIAGISFFLIDNFFTFNGNTVEVLVDGDVVESFPLDVDDNYEIKIGNYFNQIIVKDKCVYIKTANCKDLLCVKQGKITEGGQNIICLPHKLVVRIVNENNNSVDAISN